MARNGIQFQKGLSLPEFQRLYGTEEQCEAALEKARWPDGFRCPRCNGHEHGLVYGRRLKRYQCRNCSHQTTLTAGTILQATKLPLTNWFLAFYLIGQAKNGISSLELSRHLGVNYDTAWLLHNKILRAMSEREEEYLLRGKIQIDDAYLGGERTGGKVGRGSENKIPIVAAVSLNESGHPIHAKIAPVNSFSSEAIANWSLNNLTPGSDVLSDGLACFRAVTTANCHHKANVTTGKHPSDLPQFRWINTLLGNLKTSFNGTFHAFNFDKYAKRYLGGFCFRFNRRFAMAEMTERIANAVCCCMPCTERDLRLAEAYG
ncbi:IS1595 family transposase [Synechococcus sp. CBW1006]|uniref:IS1595 family transposase n=1 Tax=Synechococcus sp. CBW1006 TaxID=1353138 RepID=UPI0018CEEE1E|nr:IS1595 family transposase [Synechococcus sp. CBW1006]QPN67559.1 IS1595 family transposase [Synechococcus sp. CBW1006]